MEKNYTPLNIDQFNPNKKNGSDKLTLVLMIIATITAAILAFLLFFLIQKKLQKQNFNNSSQILPQQLPTKTNLLPISPAAIFRSPTIATSPAVIESDLVKQATGATQLKKPKIGTNEAGIIATATPIIGSNK